MMDPQTMMMLMNPMMMQRMAPERQRLLAASNPSSTSPRPKEELPRSWAPHNMSSSPANLSRQGINSVWSRYSPCFPLDKKSLLPLYLSRLQMLTRNFVVVDYRAGQVS